MSRGRVVLVAALASCSHGSGKKVTMERNDCHDAIEGLLSGDPARLRGLPAGCTVAQIDGLIDPVRTRAAMLGDESYDVHEVIGAKAAMAYLDGPRIALVDLDEPPRTVADYVAALGAPEAKLPYTHRDVVRPDSDWVWPTRGISLAASPEIKGVIRVAIFAPTTLEAYQRSLRFFDVSRDEE